MLDQAEQIALICRVQNDSVTLQVSCFGNGGSEFNRRESCLSNSAGYADETIN
jgi:hypothetical protein